MNFNLLKTLCECSGVSSDEGKIANIIKCELDKFLNNVSIDKMGNVLGRNNEKEDIVLVTHMDEIGLIVKNITENGFIEFEKVGGIFDQFLPYQKVLVHGNAEATGIICPKIDIDLTREKMREKVIRYSDMYIDTGFTKKELYDSGIQEGTIVSFCQPVKENKDNIIGKAFDCRVGCFAVIELARRLYKKMNLCMLFTTQEEIGLKGARTAFFNLNPKLVIEIEITSTSDIPNLNGRPVPIGIGKGPVINIADGMGEGLIGGFIAPKDLISKVREMKNRNLQWKISIGGSSDASVIQLNKSGIPTLSIAVPVRYPHTPVGIVKQVDIESTVEFVESFLLKLKEEKYFEK